MADAGEKSRPRDWWADNDVTKVAPIRPKRFFRRPWSIFLLLKNRSDSSTKLFLMIRSRKRRHRSFVKKMTNIGKNSSHAFNWVNKLFRAACDCHHVGMSGCLTSEVLYLIFCCCLCFLYYLGKVVIMTLQSWFGVYFTSNPKFNLQMSSVFLLLVEKKREQISAASPAPSCPLFLPEGFDFNSISCNWVFLNSSANIKGTKRDLIGVNEFIWI